MSNKKHKYSSAKSTVIVMFICLLIGNIAYNTQERKARKAAQEQEILRKKQRGDDFANYIINDTRKWVVKNQDEDKIMQYIAEYQADPDKYNAKIDSLIQDSTKYANAIFRDAGIINFLDTLPNYASFREAMAYVNSQTTEHKYVEKKSTVQVEPDGQGGVVAWSEFVPGDTIVEYNRTPARILKINKRHLRNISLELAMRRQGKNR